MGSASDHWTSFQNLHLESEHTLRIKQLLSTANFPFLCAEALQIRRTLDAKSKATQTQDESLTCSIDSNKFASGQYNVVFELRFSDSKNWIARIRLPSKTNADDEVEFSILSEIATMRLVSSRTSLPVPRVYGFDIAAQNSFGFRYVLMEALPGHILDGRFSQSVPQTQWDKVTDQLADYYHQLSSLRFESIGRISCGLNIEEESYVAPYNGMGPFTTSLEYFYTFRKIQNRAIRAQHGDDEQWATAAWILEQALPSMVVEEHIRGPFPLGHLDWHYGNMLVDDDYNITGIIDWSDAQTVPLERFIISPEFVTFPGLSAEQNATIITFREKFAAALRMRELVASKSCTVARPLLSDLLGTPLWDIVYRCTYSYHWRALSDARLVLRQVFGSNAKWEDFIAFYRNAPIHSKTALSTQLQSIPTSTSRRTSCAQGPSADIDSAGLENGDAKRSPSVLNSSRPSLGKRRLRPTTGQALRPSTRKPSQKDGKKMPGPQRRPKKVSSNSLPLSSGMDAAEPQPSLVPVNLRRSQRIHHQSQQS